MKITETSYISGLFPDKVIRLNQYLQFFLMPKRVLLRAVAGQEVVAHRDPLGKTVLFSTAVSMFGILYPISLIFPNPIISSFWRYNFLLLQYFMNFFLTMAIQKKNSSKSDHSHMACEKNGYAFILYGYQLEYAAALPYNFTFLPE
jgi:hypothetical protein